MSLWGSIQLYVRGDLGPPDIVTACDQTGTTLRLPSRWHPVAKTRLWLLLPFAIGPLVIYATINGTLSFPEHEQDIAGMWMLVAATAVGMAVRFYKWRVVWHHEIRLTVNTLQTVYRSTLFNARGPTIQLEPIKQFTVVRGAKDSVLQAEAEQGTPLPIVRDTDHELLVRLAIKLAEERDRLDPASKKTRVAAETNLRGAFSERADQPLHSKIVLTSHESGVTFDFPLSENCHTRALRQAWMLFHIAMCILVGAIIVWALCSMLDLPDWIFLPVLAFIGGIVLLIVAAYKSTRSWSDSTADDDLFQLAVAGNLLIRTVRHHRKQIWYRQEIEDVVLEDEIESVETSGDGDSSVIAELYHLKLVVRYHGGKATLAHWDSKYPLEDYRPKAELEWVATVLRGALTRIALERNSAIETLDAANAVMAGRTKQDRKSMDTRITS